MTAFAPRQVLPPWLVHSLLAVLLLASLALHFNNLGHRGMKDLDEAYHAVVARSMLDDPLKPTLYATPYQPFDYRDWQHNGVWLHKPPVALWQIAGSFAVFGESNFTLRLPSALLATAAVALTFLIGRSLFTVEAGLFAAMLQALSPAITRLVHGQVFSDHVDVAMLFWCELAVWLLIRAARSGRPSDAAIVGVAQAIAWMTKSYPALFVTGLAVVLVAIRYLSRPDGSRDKPTRPGDFSPPVLQLSLRQLLIFAIATILVAAPWITICLNRYPREFLFEQFHILSHLGTNIENFAAPWDRLLADYLQRGFFEWYPLAIVATAIVTIDAIRTRDDRRIFLAAWAWGLLVPHVLATSKTPTATLIGWPAGWLAIGVLFSDALRGRLLAIGCIAVAAILILVWRQRPATSVMGYGEGYHFGKIAAQHWPIFASAAVIAVGGLLMQRLRTATPGRATLTILMLLAALPHIGLAIRTSQDVPADPLAFPQLGQFVRSKSPSNAVFLVDEQSRGEYVIAMWWLNRECYPIRPAQLEADVETIEANSGAPFILSRRDRREKPLIRIDREAAIYPIASPATRPTSQFAR